MNEFDIKAPQWDNNQMHRDRSAAIVKELISRIPVSRKMRALEYGAGTGITSFLMKDLLKEITMMDSSIEMVRVMEQKIIAEGADNLKALFFDLEKEEWTGEKFDLVMTQMVLHHVIDLDNILVKFRNIIAPGGYLAIADLYPEDGSFHGNDFTGHKGFDVEDLSEKIRNLGFSNIKHRKCFVINKMITDNVVKHYDVFLLTGELVNTGSY
ncbi:MAG: class I SAM-dependent methyltransferase [Bacteroidales bacterium]